jgi:hypothetical protein
VEAGDIDGGTPPTGITSKHSQLARPGPVPVDDDSWDAEHAWRNSAALVGASGAYQGRRRTKGTAPAYRWWIGGAAAVIAAVAAGVLIMAPHSGTGDPPSGTSSRPNTQSTGGLGTNTGDSPLGGGSAPVGTPTAATSGQQPFSVTIEAESGSPMVVLIGSAVVESDERASGGQIVTKLGNSGNGAEPGAVRIVGISVPSAGTYRISVYYANRDDTSHSSAVFTVTGAEPTTVTFTGNRKCCGERTIDVMLAAGQHVLTITNATGPAPSIDKLVVSRV